ncbi:HCL012Cp [Eremothecium sinecaudum]|uniref:Mitochondrial distribution and morphology protein 12 n=1 Tax=Eremothecium sinecaudum TaxID=45286 RepID=A0A0X8HRJ8_9SACH|nr:HCL012Cp [Eremothecium sinecaudum]AMD20139.1 HCL012Cp [Eremothecium sinecaudum]
MSFDINWDKISGDPHINQHIKEFLNLQLESIELPSYVSNIKMIDFKLGGIPPTITLKQIGDPLDEFYQAIIDEGSPMGDKNTDIQFLVELDYKGDMLMEVSAELLLNYPSPKFMRLPVKLSISDIGMHCLCIVAYLQKQLFVSFLCDISDPILDNEESLMDNNGPTFGLKGLERISLIRSIQIKTAIGQQGLGEGAILRNVGKLEQFLTDIFKNMIRKEAAWPSWINFDFNDEEEDDIYD